MHFRWLIIDGNNLIHSAPELARHAGRNFDLARFALVQMLTPFVGEMADRITVIFDGQSGNQAPGFDAAAVEVQFSPSQLSADAVIERLVWNTKDRAGMAVVSSDRMERDAIEAGGVHTLSCRTFWEMLSREREALERRVRNTGKQEPPATLGDFFPRRPS